MKKYEKQMTDAKQITGHIQPTLDQLVLEGARRLIQQALHEEIQTFLGRNYYEHHEPGQQKRYRNGYGRQRRIVVGSGSIPVQVPRLREPFESQIVRRYQRMSEQMQQLLPQLYLHGLATGDFRQCFDAYVGSEAPLSPTSIVRLKQTWQKEYEAWSKRSLEEDYLYVWADGVYPKAGPKSDSMAVLVVNLFRASYGKLYPKAVASLEDVLDELFTYMQFPKQHWPSIKSTNVIESIFASVKLRTNAAKRIPSRESALYLVFKLVITQQQRFRKINAYKLVNETIYQQKQNSTLKIRHVA